MNNDTLTILECLRRQRRTKITSEMLHTLCNDIQELGANTFVTEAMEVVANRRTTGRQSPTRTSDPLLQFLKRSQQALRVNAEVLNTKLASSCGGYLVQPPSRATLRSTPKLLSFLRQHMTDEEIRVRLTQLIDP